MAGHCGDRPFDNRRQLTGSLNSLRVTGIDNRVGNASRKPFFTIAVNEIRQIRFVGMIHNISCGFRGGDVEPHVQGPVHVLGKAQASRRVIDLRRAKPQVRQEAIHTSQLRGVQHVACLGKIPVKQANLTPKRGEVLTGQPKIPFIGVHADQRRLRTHRLQQRPGVATQA